MSLRLILKLIQIVGVFFMIAGVASCQMGTIENTPILMLIGAILYGGGRLSAWLLSTQAMEK